ncbi:hypothetical protein ScPMuIL_007750, partial [Solemya velum]
YGQIHVCVRELVLEKFGQETWTNVLLHEQKFQRDVSFAVQITNEYSFPVGWLVGYSAAKTCMRASLSTVLEIFGEYFLQYCLRHGYDKMLRTLGSDFKSFIQNLDSLHSLLALSYKNIDAPSFRCETDRNGILELHYYTIRPGLYPIVQGLIKAVARDLYNQSASLEVISKLQETIKGGKSQEHVVFKVTLDDIHNTNRSLCQANVFTPVFPKEFHISSEQFCGAFPYHIIFDDKLRVRQCGLMIQKLLHINIADGSEMTEIFDIIHPRMVINIKNILMFINAVFMLAVKMEGDCQPGLVLKGKMMWLSDIQHMIFISSPRLSSLSELMEMNVYLADIPLYDVTRELVLLNQQRIAEIDIAKKLDETTIELKKTSRALQCEKKKTETLLYQMLPEKVADDLKNGRQVEAEKFEQVTVLFSDIVTFTSIAAACTPMDVVNMLNNLYQRFDKRTNEHNVYKVETIGDAYMVVCGAPTKTNMHAEPVANFAMDMVDEAAKVNSPATDKPLQIRVGIHTGPVVAGVVGMKMPRFCLFGDTVNTASRMESHGAPGRIHLSPTSFNALKGKGYLCRARGDVDIKGKGKMETYFLIGKINCNSKEPADEYCKLPIVDGVCSVICDKNVTSTENNKLSKIYVIDKRSTESTKTKRRRSDKHKLKNSPSWACATM